MSDIDLEDYFDDDDLTAFEHLPDHYDKQSLADDILTSEYGLDSDNRAIFEELPESIDKDSLLESLRNSDGEEDTELTVSNDAEYDFSDVTIDGTTTTINAYNYGSPEYVDVADLSANDTEYDAPDELIDYETDTYDFDSMPDYPDYPDHYYAVDDY